MTSQPATVPPLPLPAPTANGPAVRLPRPPARSKARSRWFLFGSLALVLAAGGAAGWYFVNARAPRTDLVLHKVKRENIVQKVVERGEMVSKNNHDIINLVNHEALANTKTSIKDVVPDGTRVKKGDLLIRLDDAKLQDLLRTQGITRDKASNDFIFAKAHLQITNKGNATDLETAQRTLSLAESALQKYQQGEYPQALKDVNSRIEQAAADLEQNRDYAAYAERQVRKQFMSESQAQAARSRLRSTELNVQKLNTELDVLTNFTGPQTIKELTGKRDDAKALLEKLKISTEATRVQAENDLKTKESIFKQEDQKYKDIEGEIKKCVITAPESGMVVYYVSQQSRRGSGQAQGIVAEGEQVFLGQKLMQIPDLKQMIVNTRIHEAKINAVEEKMRAVIKPLSFPGIVLKGEVKKVANVAAAQDWFSAGDVKVYEAMVEIENEPDGLKPGMSAEVTITTNKTAYNVLAVPVQAVVRVPGREVSHKLYVNTADGIRERDVTVGLSDEKLVEIKTGLEEGDEVVLNVDVLKGDKNAGKGGGEGAEGKGGDKKPGGPPGGGSGGWQGGGQGAQGGRPGGTPPGGGQPGGVPPGGGGQQGGGRKS